MKKQNIWFLLISILLCSQWAMAGDTLRIPDLSVVSTISFSNLDIKIRSEGTPTVIKAKAIASGLSITKAEEQKLLHALRTDKQSLADAMAIPDTGKVIATLLEKLATGKELVLAPEANVAEGDLAPEVGGQNINPANEKGWSTTTLVLIALAAFILGSLIFYFIKRKDASPKARLKDDDETSTTTYTTSENTTTINEAMATTNSPKAEKVMELRATIKTLEVKLKKHSDELMGLKEEVRLLKTENKELKTQMGSWVIQFKNLLTRYLIPMHRAMDEGRKSEVIAKGLQAAMQISSVAKIATQNSERYDAQNASFLKTGESKGSEGIPTITANTAQDKIPRNLKTLIEILKENNANWDETIVKDYKIGPLS